MINKSQRLEKVRRIFDPYSDRSEYVRLDRNEDPIGYELDFFNGWKSELTVHDIAAYADSTVLVEKLSQWLKCNGDEIYISAGSDALIKNIFETYIDSGDIILTQKPAWRMYDVYAKIYGADCQCVCYNDEFVLDIDEIIKKLESENVKMLLLANPNQPTGTLIQSKDIETILSVAHKKNTLVIMDEAYHLFTDETAIEYTKMYDNLIIARTFSKAFGLAGLRIGYAVANPVRIEEMMTLRPVTDANSLALNFAGYLLDNINIVMNKINDFNNGREYLYKMLSQANINCQRSYTNFLLVPCLDEKSAKDLLSFAKSKKYLLKGPFKEEPINNYIRITVGPLVLMKSFWSDCGDAIVQYSVKAKENILEKNNAY